MLALIIGIAVGCSLFPGSGSDWYRFFTQYANDPTGNQFPPFIYLILTPIASLPDSFAWFNALNVLIFGLLLFLIEFPAPLVIFTLPVFWIFFYGQVDHWVALGAVLGLWALKREKPLWSGAGALLMMAKPHIGLPLAVFTLWKARHWKMLVIPGAVALISFILYGFWPIQYVQFFFKKGYDYFVSPRSNISLLPWSLALLPLIVLRWKKMTLTGQAIAVQGATCLLLPYAPVYSIIPLLFIVDLPLAPLLLFPAWFGYENAVFFSVLFTLACLAYALFGQTAEAKTAQPVEDIEASPV